VVTLHYFTRDRKAKYFEMKCRKYSLNLICHDHNGYGWTNEEWEFEFQ
jgi:hypothetical protein